MTLILFALLSLIVVTAAQDVPNSLNPKEWHTSPDKKPGVCAPPYNGWNLGPHPLKKKSESKSSESPESLNLHYPWFVPDYFWFYEQPRYYPPQVPRCSPQCITDADCTGTMKCCGSRCNARCAPPLQYDSDCGLIPTDAYCKELCDKKSACLTTPAPNCRDYSGHCVSFCRDSGSCYGRKCCRNLRCSFSCV